tara:strand:+ start:384 stop:1370 length:987 start_codon:yes stop_codon:yes gene_type:complete
MVQYTCFRCGYSTNQKKDMRLHLKRKNICDPIIRDINLIDYSDKILNKEKFNEIEYQQNLIPNIPIYSKNIPNDSNQFQCKYCDNKYKYRYNLTKHLKNCKYKKKEEKEETNNLLLEQINEQKKMIENQGETIEELQKQVNKVKKKTNCMTITNNTTNNTTNNNTTNNTQININLNRVNYSQINYDKIDSKDIMYAIGRSMKSLETMVELIHFNNKYPQYQNMYMPDLKSSSVMMYDQDQWMAYPLSKASVRLMDHSRVTMSDWVIMHGGDHPNLQKKFNRFLEGQRDEDVVKAQIRDIKILMFNKREMPKSDKTVELLQNIKKEQIK